MIWIASIPHSGTRFVRDHLLRKLPTKAKTAEHVWPDARAQWLERLQAATWPVIVPVRHPMAVAHSWKRRGKDVFDLPDMWSWLATVMDRFDPYYLAVDSRCRDRQLEQINAGLGLELTTDWRIVRSRADGASQQVYRGDVALNNRERASVVDTWWHLDHFFGRWYEGLEGDWR